MYLLIYFYTAFLLKSSLCRFVANNENLNLQRYANNNPESYQMDRSALRNSQASDKFYSLPRGERTIQEPVGIVYGNGKPIGFLQPYGNVYQITSEELNNQLNKREYADVLYPFGKPAVEQEENVQEAGTSRYNSEYPAVLANFKIDSRLKNIEPPMKREFLKESPKISKREVGLTKKNVDRLKDALSNYDETPESKASLQEILSEMGFTEYDENNGPQKRESLEEEDEDMEKGVNAIRVIKEDTHGLEKRKLDQRKAAHEENNETHNTAAEVEEEDKEKMREKRNNHDNTTQHNSELMKNLEKSGELTVSGNKSPLASSGEAPKNVKQNNDKESETEEERVAREIQAKIDAIKDQVKRQIAEAKEKENGERKKRDVNNLLHEENLRIDPRYNVDEVDEIHHVRRKRSTNEDREKRDVDIPLSPYREENEEMDEEDDEFEDDGFYDRTAELNGQNRLYYRQPPLANNLKWENSFLQNNVRKKRNNSSEQKQKVLEHLNAVKERSEMPKDYPKKDEGSLKGAQVKLQQIAEMSDSDLFGPLPEGYEGELVRYKRVKRG